MKSVKRYEGKIEHCDNGGYVTFTEYKRLEARLENATGRVCTLAERIAELERDNSMILSGADWMEYLADITRKAFERAEAAEKELAALREQKIQPAPVAVPDDIKIRKALLWIEGVIAQKPGMKEAVTCAEVLRLNSGSEPQRFVVKLPSVEKWRSSDAVRACSGCISRIS